MDVKMRAGANVMAAADPDNNANRKGERRKMELSGDVSDITAQVQLQAHLGRTLKTIYQALVDEPVPDKLLKLLELLDAQDRKQDKSN
ncbi:MAG TPA: NepR family anti-sigma factor [Hyphomicrobiaceae bacterium]|jgi:hypothetical protein|nr:NepR family anti-sigma factor [Hyphomicrobiaceae bacterium]